MAEYYKKFPVQVRVGPDLESFWIPEALLIQKVPYFFKPALGHYKSTNGFEAFREGHEKIIDLPEDDVEGFVVILEWILGKGVEMIPLMPAEVYGETFLMAEIHGVDKYIQPWFEALLTADKYCLTDLVVILLERLREFFEGHDVVPGPVLVGCLADIARPGTYVCDFLDDQLRMARLHHDRFEFANYVAILMDQCPDWAQDWEDRRAAADRAEVRRLKHNRSSRISHAKRRQRLQEARYAYE